MDTLSYKTISANKETADKKWLVIDAEGQKLGRVCSRIALVLRGKHKTNYTPHADCGDYVIVLNADKVELSGNKWEAKNYLTFSGYPGGQKSIAAKDLMEKHPIAMIEKGVKGMLPKNRLGRALFRNLNVYAGAEHPHEAQNPQKIDLKDLNI